jgi:hypothetical protein
LIINSKMFAWASIWDSEIATGAEILHCCNLSVIFSKYLTFIIITSSSTLVDSIRSGHDFS